MAKPALPEVLKKTNWDKQKGIIAKISKKETGIGAGLDEILAAYNAVPWAKLDDKLAETATTAAQGNAIFTEGRKVLNTEIDTLRKKCMALNALAKKTAADFKSPLLKGPKEYLGKMAEGAVNFSVISRDETIETLKKFEALEKNLNAEAEQIATAVKARTDAAKLIAIELGKVENDEKQVTIAVGHANDVMKNLATGKGPAANAAEIRNVATGVAKLLSATQVRYKTLQTNPTVVSARMAASPGTNVAKAVAVQSGTIWTKGSNDFVAINKIISTMEQSLSALETLADKAEMAASTSTKTDGDFLKLAKAALPALESLQKDIALAHTRAKDCPDRMQEYLDANKKGTMDAPTAKKSGKIRIDDGTKRVTQIEEFRKTAQNEIQRFSSFPQNLQAVKEVKDALAKAKTLDTYALTCINSGKSAVAEAQKILNTINALK